MGDSDFAVRTIRAFQNPLPLDLFPAESTTYEPQGVVYTKRWVVDLLLDLAGYTSEHDLIHSVAIEPSAGDGAFFVPMVERLAQRCLQHNHPIESCQSALIAFELNPMSAERVRSSVIATLIKYGVTNSIAHDLAHIWVQTGDYLLESLRFEADYVIGNPPYVRLEDIPEEVCQFYRSTFQTMRGRADLYVAFFEAALRQLKVHGTCAFICADRWMRNQYGSELRKLITSGFSVDAVIEMHNANAFHDEVDAYPAITIIRRNKQQEALIARAGPSAAEVDSLSIVRHLSDVRSGSSPTVMPCLRAAKIDRWFDGSEPWPCDSPQRLELLRRLEDRFASLETYAKVGIGVATGNDRIFITRKPDIAEPDRMLRLAMASDLRSGTLQWSGHYLVNPWNCTGLVDLDQYPKLKQFYCAHAPALKARHTALKNQQGWYKTIDRVNHSLTTAPKLYVADINNQLDPVLDRGETYPHHNLYFIQSDEWNLEVLGGLLMSQISQFFVELYGVRLRGGYLRFQAQYLRRIRIPSPQSLSAEDAEALRLAFRKRDRGLATQIALKLYDVDRHTLETALED
ncbi:MAG: Eco57I restriction-modification methylase domain-containing protein [Terracidiphilus sp.]|nr:Eco57I restriction-modification methylase domain-containing protein [Terracidiphilus sp.]